MTLRTLRAGRKAVEEAAKVIKAGKVVAVPTDTVYGLACDPFNDAAVQGLFEAKDRRRKPGPILGADVDAASKLVELNSAAKRLAADHWPGALTIVAPLRKGVMLSQLVHPGTETLGVRVPDSELCLDIASRVGGAITGTSANPSGSPSSRTAAQVVESLGERLALVIDGGELRGKESTVVKVSGSTVEVLREGSVRIQEGKSKA